MRRRPLKAYSLVVRAACVLAASASVARAQSIEPRAYSNAPVGVNFVLAGLYYTRGGLSFDTSLPVTDPQLKTYNAVLGYARALDLWGKSGKFDVVVPYTWLSGTASYRGDTVERQVDGFADPLFRLSVNFYGAPALTAAEFKSYEQDLIVGTSLQVSVPVGQYDSTKLINIGTNRWSFKPEIGVSKALGALTLEFQVGVTLFTTNDDFFNGNKRSQDPPARLRNKPPAVAAAIRPSRAVATLRTFFSATPEAGTHLPSRNRAAPAEVQAQTLPDGSIVTDFTSSEGNPDATP